MSCTYETCMVGVGNSWSRKILVLIFEEPSSWAGWRALPIDTPLFLRGGFFGGRMVAKMLVSPFLPRNAQNLRAILQLYGHSWTDWWKSGPIGVQLVISWSLEYFLMKLCANQGQFDNFLATWWTNDKKLGQCGPLIIIILANQGPFGYLSVKNRATCGLFHDYKTKFRRPPCDFLEC